MFWIDLIGVIPLSTIIDVSVGHQENQGKVTLLRLFRLVSDAFDDLD